MARKKTIDELRIEREKAEQDLKMRHVETIVLMSRISGGK